MEESSIHATFSICDIDVGFDLLCKLTWTNAIDSLVSSMWISGFMEFIVADGWQSLTGTLKSSHLNIVVTCPLYIIVFLLCYPICTWGIICITCCSSVNMQDFFHLIFFQTQTIFFHEFCWLNDNWLMNLCCPSTNWSCPGQISSQQWNKSVRFSYFQVVNPDFSKAVSTLVALMCA